MLELVIEKNIPLAPKRTGLTEKLREMEVGDSMLLPRSLHSSVSVITSRLAPAKFARRSDGDQFRLWRTE